MQSAITRSLVLTLGLLGFLAAAPIVSAQIHNHSGTICKNYDSGDVTFIDYLTNGVRSRKTETTRIICPLVRGTNNRNGAWVYVDVSHGGTQTTTCQAYSFNVSGTLLASPPSQTWTGSGFHEFAFDLTGDGKSVPWSDYSVLCSIPGNVGGVILGVDLSEQ
jgi:hypothetical protein